MPIDVTAAHRPPPPRRPVPRGVKSFGIVMAILAAVAVAWGVFARGARTHDAQTWSDRQAAPTVTVIRASSSAGGHALSLPGALAAQNSASIYARVSGYLKSWNQDIGARVAAGQLLATLDTPDLDQQVTQARADLTSAQAMQRLSATTAARWKDLLSSDAVSQQEADEKSGDLAAKTALVQASRANLDRLLTLKGFARITAPFAGVVTTRNANIGDLVNAGAGAQPLFVVSDVSRIRVYVRVPQGASADLKPGVTAALKLPEYPGRTFPATLVSNAGSINAQSGTLLVQLSAANADSALKPGAFAQVDFEVPARATTLRLPASALLFRKEGLQVAVLDASNHVHLHRVSVARDLGQEVEIGSGVTAQDRVIDNPPDSVADGEAVRLAPPSHG